MWREKMEHLMNPVRSLVDAEAVLAEITGIALRLQQEGELGEIVQRAIDDIRTLLQTDRVLVYHFLEDDDFVALESVGQEWTPLLRCLSYDRSFESRWIERYKQGQVTPIADIHGETIDPIYAQLLKQLQVQANLIVPIFSRGNLWGLLIAHHCSAPRQWQTLEIQILQHVALHLVMAVRQAELHQHQHPVERQLGQSRLGQSRLGQSRIVERHSETIVIKATQNGWHKQGTEAVPQTVQVQAKGYAAELARVHEALRRTLEKLRVAEERLNQRNLQPEFDELFRQQSERQRLITAIAQDISQTQDLDHILHTAVTEVRNFLHTDRVIICRSELDGSGIVIAESVAEGLGSILGTQIIDPALAATEEDGDWRHITVVNDTYRANLASHSLTLLEQMQVRAELVSPILQADHLWGILDAQHYQAPRLWTALEIELLQHLSLQIEIAVRQEALYQQVQTLNADLEFQVQDRTAQLQKALEFEALLKRITDQVRDSLDEEQILQKVVQELPIALQAVCCDTTTYNADRTVATVKCAQNLNGFIAPNLVFAIADSADPNLYGQLFQGQYCHFCLIDQEALCPDQVKMSILICPMMDEQGVCGDLRLFKLAHQSFNDLEVRLVQQVANQCAIALRQSRLYQEAQAQVQELERLNQLKDDFLCTVSHELRSPMCSIKMATHMLEISLDPLGILQNEAISRYFRILREEGQREVDLINDLLDLTRLETGTAPLRLTTIALQYYIPYLVEPFNERARQRQQQLAVHIPDNLPLLTTDVSYLERLLTELLHNACKYTPAQETITVSAQATSEMLEICINNTGVEIPIAERDRIFDKFYRIPNSDPWKHGGTGLGLALVKKLTKQLGGNIRVESSDGQTTFILELEDFAKGLNVAVPNIAVINPTRGATRLRRRS